MTCCSGRIMPKDDCLISLVDLCLSKDFNHERRSIDQENSWKPADAIPNLTWNCLNWSYDDNILLFAFQIFGPKRKNEMHDGRMDTADNHMIFQL